MFKIKKILAVILISLLLISIFAGCNGDTDLANGYDVANDTGDEGAAQVRTVSADQLAEIVRDGEFEEADFIFDPPIHGMARNQTLEWEINFDPADRGFDDLRQLINVYADSDFLVSVNPRVTYDADKGALVVTPINPQPSLIGITSVGDSYWGYSPQYFAVRYYSLDGERLERPVVTVFTIESELEAPFISFFVEDGFATFTWKPVEGALEYHFFIINRWHSEALGYYYMEFNLFVTEETSYTYVSIDTIGGRLVGHNVLFNLDDPDDVYFVAAVAVGEDSVSQLSNVIHSSEIAPLLPFNIVFGEDGEDMANAAINVNDLGVFRWIRMADGSLVKMPVNYHIEDAEVYDMHILAPSAFDPGEMLGMRIPYTVQGIGMEGFSAVRDFDYPEFEQDLIRLREREITDHRAARITPNIERATGDEVIPDEEIELNIDEFRVNASNPFSEFLAIHMLNGAEHVDFRAFPEAFDSEFLIAAWHEAIYQNPLVLKVRGISWTIFGDLFIEYGLTREEQERQQGEIMREVRRIVDEIITDDMTDFEKQLAINNYLIDNAEYDFAALEYAEQYNFMHVDSRFYNSFTAYGILIDGVGVCSGYAAAFRLLADEVGLPNVVVTGHMFGTLPHAWNRVLIDGEWLTIDVTNNDDEFMRNIFFNLPDHVSESILVEDGRFSMSGISYAGHSYHWEYYRTAGLFYSIDEIAAALARDLDERGYATLRTNYDLSDDEFFTIVMEVARLGGFDISSMIGGNMLGAIFLGIEE